MKKRFLLALIVLMGLFLLSSSIVWAADAPVPKTGQTTSYATGDDGDLEKGVAWPSPRFTDHGDGTVTDNLTGLMWAKNANLANGTMTWNNALAYANSLSLGNAGCSTSYTDWRLPNRFELSSLLDLSNYIPSLPTGHPFTNVQNTDYWSSNTVAINTIYAWVVIMSNSIVSYTSKTSSVYVWPVRDAN